MKTKIALLALIVFIVSASAQDSTTQRTLDSLDNCIQILERTWTHSKRFADAQSTGDRLEALTFYMSKNVLNDAQVESLALNLQNQKHFEQRGTELLIQTQTGKQKTVALAHLKKVQSELSKISDFLLTINSAPVEIVQGGKAKM